MRKFSIFKLLAALAALLLFAGLAMAVSNGSAQAFDDPVRAAVHSYAAPWLTTLMRGLSQMGEPLFLIVLGGLVVGAHLRRGRPRTALLFFVTVLGAEGLDQLLKYVFHRMRPEPFFGLAEPAGYSFPSGHALVSCAFFGALAVMAAARTESRGRRALYYAAGINLIGGIGLSRVYLGVHYPTDVLGGYAAGADWLLGMSIFNTME